MVKWPDTERGAIKQNTKRCRPTVKTRLSATLKEPSKDEAERESYGPEREWTTSTNAGELNPRTYTRNGPI